MFTFWFSTIRAGVRSRAIQSILIFAVVLVVVAFLSASFSPRQPQTVALDVGVSGIRFSLILFALFWIQELVSNEIQRRTILFALTYPIDRGTYLLGRFLGILTLLALTTVLLGVALWAVVWFAGGGYEQSFTISSGGPYWAVMLGLWVDVAVVAAFGLMISTLSTVPILPLALGLAFATGTKAIGAVAEYLAKGADGDVELLKLAPLIDAIQWVLPDLSRLDWRTWPMYGAMPDSTVMIGGLVVAVSYIVLLMSIAVILFNRREFL